MDLGGEPVVVLSAGEGNDWAHPTERTVVTVAPLEPRTADTSVVTESGWNIYLPDGDPITRQDRVRVRGRVYTVRAAPDVWPDTCVVAQLSAVDRNATVSLHKAATSAWSDEDEATVATPGEVTDSLSARIQPLILRSHTDVETAEEALTAPPYMITLDHEIAPDEGDEIEVTDCPADPSLVGRFFRVDHVTRGIEGVDRGLWTVLVDVPAA